MTAAATVPKVAEGWVSGVGLKPIALLGSI